MTSRRTALAAAATVLALGGGLVLSAPAGASTPTPSAATPSATAKACDRTPWEAKVQGAPKSFGSGSPSGDYLWHDTSGFHLRVTHVQHDQRVYSGTITASAPMRIERVKLEKGDTAKLSSNRRSIVFVFANHGYVDGINFHTDCASAVNVSRLHIGNNNVSTKQVYLGATKAHPSAVPFTVHRKAVPAA